VFVVGSGRKSTARGDQAELLGRIGTNAGLLPGPVLPLPRSVQTTLTFVKHLHPDVLLEKPLPVPSGFRHRELNASSVALRCRWVPSSVSGLVAMEASCDDVIGDVLSAIPARSEMFGGTA
jgi:hypothetical protein